MIPLLPQPLLSIYLSLMNVRLSFLLMNHGYDLFYLDLVRIRLMNRITIPLLIRLLAIIVLSLHVDHIFGVLTFIGYGIVVLSRWYSSAMGVFTNSNVGRNNS